MQDIEPTFLVFPHVKNRIKKTYFYASPYTPEKSVIARENSHRISYLSVSLFVCTPMMSIACYSRHGGICILPLAHVCVHLYLRCRFIQSFDLHTAGLHHLPTQWGVRANCNSITVTRFVISSFTFHLTRLDLQHIRYALTINFLNKNFLYGQE